MLEHLIEKKKHVLYGKNYECKQTTRLTSNDGGCVYNRLATENIYFLFLTLFTTHIEF